MLNGTHTISWWCKLQSVVALSSCEAELNASLKGAREGLYAQGLAADFGDDPSLELKTDASAARGVIMRQGLGKIRHLHVKQLWLQEKVALGDLIISKIPRSDNWSDALTHPWTPADLPFGKQWDCDASCHPVRLHTGYKGRADPSRSGTTGSDLRSNVAYRAPR